MTSKAELEKIRDSYLFTSEGEFVPTNQYDNFILYNLIDSAINVLPEEKLEKMTPDEVIIYTGAAVFGGIYKDDVEL